MSAAPSNGFLTVLCQPLGSTEQLQAMAVMDRLLAELLDRESPHREEAIRGWRTDERGRPVALLQFPAIWIERLDRAAAGGAFERMNAEAIVSRILTTEPPAIIEGEVA